jgi:hypothetical protein
LDDADNPPFTSPDMFEVRDCTEWPTLPIIARIESAIEEELSQF